MGPSPAAWIGVVALILCLVPGFMAMSDQSATATTGFGEHSLALSNRLVAGIPPDREGVLLALACFRSNSSWMINTIWRSWPELVLREGTNAKAFVESGGMFPGAVLDALLALRGFSGNAASPLSSGVYWLMGQKRYRDALDRIRDSGLATNLRPLAAWLALKTGENELALEYLRAHVTAQADPPFDEMKLVFNLALRPGAYQEAVYWGNRMLTKAPGLEKNLQWVNNMAFALTEKARSKRGEEAHMTRLNALRYARSALELSRSAPVLHTMAVVCAALSNYQDAARHLQLALALDTGNTNYRSFLLEMQRKIRG